MMRNFEERKAEVFRRSEKRIKERKQRRKLVLTACVPSVLCLALALVFLFPEKPAAPVDSCSAECYGTVFYDVSRVEVSGNGISRTYTDPKDVTTVTDFLSSLHTKHAQQSNSGSGTTRGETESVLEDKNWNSDGCLDITAGSVAGYRVTVSLANGASTTYLLTGSVLTNLDTHQSYVMTTSQLTQLRNMLGIPH